MALTAEYPMSKSKAEPREYVFVSAKIDQEVLKRAKAAASLDGKAVQEYLSDVMNRVASKALNLPPLEFVAPAD